MLASLGLMVWTSSYVGLELDWIDFGNELGLIYMDLISLCLMVWTSSYVGLELDWIDSRNELGLIYMDLILDLVLYWFEFRLESAHGLDIGLDKS